MLISKILNGEFPVLAAPLAGVTDSPFQRILFELKTPVISTEMIAAANLVRCRKPPASQLSWQPDIHPIIAQLFGYDPDLMAEAAVVLESLGADAVDINMGCPAKKVARSGSGVALMRTPELANRIMIAVRKAVSIPVSVKLRMGWDAKHRNGREYAVMAETAGMDWITIHGRYRSSYEPPADWSGIREVRESVSIPIFGNGDVFTPQDAKRMISETGCHGVMLARGMLGNPWFPGQVTEFLQTGKEREPVPLKERITVCKRHLRLLVDHLGSKRACMAFRKHAAWYLKGLPGIVPHRKALFLFTVPEQYNDLMDHLLEINS